jgi:predicted TIM-barrel fold metal-dependent hydrolase
MSGYKVISSDSHVIEPSDLWTSRLERKFRDRAPHLVRGAEGDHWWCDGRLMMGMNFAVNVGVRFEDPDKITDMGRIEDIPLGGYIPDEHVKDMDTDGVDAGILFPSYAFKLYNAMADSDLLTACFRVYNDWIIEFCNAHPDRLHSIAMLNVDDVGTGVRELERCAKLGVVGAMIPVFPPLYPHEGRRYTSPDYEPLWAAAQDLDMPLHLHILTNRRCFDEAVHAPDTLVAASGGDDSLAFLASHDHWPRMSLGDMIFSGVFERYPKLQVGSVEFDLSWIPHFLERIDYTYTDRGVGLTSGKRPLAEGMLPSDYFHQNVFAGFQEDALGIRDREIIGVDNIMWGSDYPHAESTFPRSQDILEGILMDCTEQEKAKIVGGNAARVYRLD